MKQTQVRERAHLDSLRSVDFHSKNQYFLVTGAEDGRVKIWDQRKFDKPYLSFNAHSHWVFAVKFSRNIGFMLASAGADAKVSTALTSKVNLFHLGSVAAGKIDKVKDSIARTYQVHEDSIYSLCWVSIRPLHSGP
jgi:WD40 repeat protein